MLPSSFSVLTFPLDKKGFISGSGKREKGGKGEDEGKKPAHSQAFTSFHVKALKPCSPVIMKTLRFTSHVGKGKRKKKKKKKNAKRGKFAFLLD